MFEIASSHEKQLQRWRDISKTQAVMKAIGLRFIREYIFTYRASSAQMKGFYFIIFTYLFSTMPWWYRSQPSGMRYLHAPYLKIQLAVRARFAKKSVLMLWKPIFHIIMTPLHNSTMPRLRVAAAPNNDIWANIRDDFLRRRCLLATRGCCKDIACPRRW